MNLKEAKLILNYDELAGQKISYKPASVLVRVTAEQNEYIMGQAGFNKRKRAESIRRCISNEMNGRTQIVNRGSRELTVDKLRREAKESKRSKRKLTKEEKKQLQFNTNILDMNSELAQVLAARRKQVE